MLAVRPSRRSTLKKAWKRVDRTRVARNIGHMLAKGTDGDDEP
jgi:hypothetical protein